MVKPKQKLAEPKTVKRASRSVPAPPGGRSAAPISWDPAIGWLFSENPALGKDFAGALPNYRAVLDKTKVHIGAIPEVKSHLEFLEGKGINPHRVLKCLAALVILNEKEVRWPRDMKRINGNLKSLSRKLRNIAREVETTYSTDTVHPHLWAASLGHFAEKVGGDMPREATRAILDTAADLEQKARAFGLLRHALTPAVRRQPEVSLLRYVHAVTWENAPKYFQRLSELLDATCGTYGVQKRFSRESLEKLFIRHVLPSPPGRWLRQHPTRK